MIKPNFIPVIICAFLTLSIQNLVLADTKPSPQLLKEKPRTLTLPSVREKKSKNKLVDKVSVRLLKGGTVTLSQFKGKVLVINFFATWCPPCMREVPHLIDFQKQHVEKVQLIAISVDEDRGALLNFASRTPTPYPIALFDNKLEATFGSITGIPATFIVDKQSRIVDRIEGYVDEATLLERVKPYL